MVHHLANSGPGSLRQAVLGANSNSGADLIRFAGGLHGTITLGSELSIMDDLTIQGRGAVVHSSFANNLAQGGKGADGGPAHNGGLGGNGGGGAIANLNDSFLVAAAGSTLIIEYTAFISN